MSRGAAVEGLASAIAPIERETLNERVYRELVNSIMAGAFRPGQELTLRSVADALGTSFMPVRDALRRLVTLRALEVLPSRKIAIPILTSSQFFELRRIRTLLEGEAAALAAEKITRRQLTSVRSILKKLDGLDETRRAEFWALNHKFHFAIYEAAESPQLFSIIESLWLQIGPLMTRIPTSRALKSSADPHHILAKALEDHDPAAAREALVADLAKSGEAMILELARQKAIRVDDPV
jgi:DNA-binding GntR family transcriptional regulator